MTGISSCVYTGTVVHKRMAPKRHAFSYDVFSLCLDVDEIDRVAQSLRWFSRNHWNVLGFHDGDHGQRDGSPVGVHVRDVLKVAGLERFGTRIKLLCYPRVFGFVFNPLSVYFCYGHDERVGAIIYEVTNTFHERRSYVIAVGDDQGAIIMQHCAKDLYVSPFTSSDGSYDFHVRPPDNRVVVGIAFREAGQAMLKTHFQGIRRELTDRGILALVVGYPMMTLKVVVGIHIQAARLWFKGVPLAARHASAPFSMTIVKATARDASHVQT